MNVLVFAVFTTVFLMAGVQFTQASIRSSRSSASNAQVYNVARAGISHAVQWLQKQTVQPVVVFDPKSFTNAPDEDPETKVDEEQLGLVHEFLIDASKNVWGRYEVARSTHIVPAPIRTPNVTATGASSALYPISLYPSGIPWTAEDISKRRGADMPGEVWRVRSRGYVFRKDATNTTFSLTNDVTKPSQTLTLEAEVRMGGFSFRNAALYSFHPDDGANWVEYKEGSSVKPRLEVETGSLTGRNYWYHTNNILNASQGELGSLDPSGSALGCSVATDTALYVDPTLSAQLRAVFGVGDLEAVQGLADSYYTSMADVPDALPSMSFVYLKGNYTFNSSKALSGGGILFVEGELKMDGSSEAQSWNGLIFTTGRFELKKQAVVTGAVMVGGYAKLEASSGDKKATITYSEPTLNLVKAKLGGYRVEQSTLRPVDEDVVVF